MILGTKMLLDQWFPIIQIKKDKRRGVLAFKVQASNEGSEVKELAAHICAAFNLFPHSE